MPVILRQRQDLSLGHLLALHAQGIHCPKTPHCGNFYPNNLAFAALGLPLMCVDHTTGDRDQNFHPHCVIRNGQRDALAHDHLLTTHTRVLRSSRLVHHGLFPIGARMIDEHMNALACAFPRASITSLSRVLRAQQDFFAAVFEESSSALDGREVWWRYVYDDGHIAEYRDNKRGWSHVSREPIFGLTDSYEGWIPPNELHIVSDIVRGALHNRSDQAYHVSGPDMYRYIGGLLRDISRMYDCVRARVFPHLPERVVLNLPAAHEMRFAVRADRRDRLDELFESYRAYCASPDTSEQRLRSAIARCPDIFYEISRADYMSQHDLIDGDRVHELYIHPDAIDMTFGECTRMMHVLRQHVHTDSASHASQAHVLW